jgi:hypothetical protein
MGCSTPPYNLMLRKRGLSNAPPRPEDTAALEVATPPRRPRPWPRISNGTGARAHGSVTPICPLQLKGISKAERTGTERTAVPRECGLGKTACLSPRPAQPRLPRAPLAVTFRPFPAPTLSPQQVVRESSEGVNGVAIPLHDPRP